MRVIMFHGTQSFPMVDAQGRRSTFKVKLLCFDQDEYPKVIHGCKGTSKGGGGGGGGGEGG